MQRSLFQAEKHGHGSYLRYSANCRCFPCRVASSRYRSECYRKQKSGQGNPYVSADPVVAHLRELSQAGVGYRAVCDVTELHHSTLQRMKNGTAKFIRKRSAEKILAVTKDAVRDGAKIPSRETRKRIQRLLQSGFTEAELAGRLQRKRMMIARGNKVIASNAMKIEKLHNQVMAEAAA